MITVRLMGGLGNQMFQYAAGRRLALRHGSKLRLDLGWFGASAPDVTPRFYELDVFTCDEQVRKASLPLDPPPPGLRARATRLLNRPPRVVHERTTAFDPAILELGDDVHLVGYWGSERYFAEVADTIVSDFTLREPLSAGCEALRGEIATNAGSVSVHIRRGDYVTNPIANRFHGELGIDYYRDALRMISKRAPVDTVYVFSDDPDWCEQHLDLGHRSVVVRGNDGRAACQDMALMSACSHHVIANSTFSWWGAWLDRRPGAVVVARQRWALDPSVDFRDVYATGWLRA